MSCCGGCFSFLMPPDPRAIELRKVKEDLKKFINERNCHPIMVRLAWHDSGTYDQRIKSWPECGGAVGGNWYDEQLRFGANAGLDKAKGYLEPFAAKYTYISHADLIQLASATAIELMGGPKIDMKYGRLDIAAPDCCVKPLSREGFAGNAGLPDAGPPYGSGAASAAQHLRDVFTKKMGFNDQEIVAISGAHTIGRVFKDRSGACPFGYGNAAASKYTKDSCTVRADGKQGVGMSGGGAWTKNWLTFDNSYYSNALEHAADPDIVHLPTDACLYDDPIFNKFFNMYAKDQAAFFEDYAKAHKKLSELGSKFMPPEGIKL